jgi:hypothetical protein
VLLSSHLEDLESPRESQASPIYRNVSDSVHATNLREFSACTFLVNCTAKSVRDEARMESTRSRSSGVRSNDSPLYPDANAVVGLVSSKSQNLWLITAAVTSRLSPPLYGDVSFGYEVTMGIVGLTSIFQFTSHCP